MITYVLMLPSFLRFKTTQIIPQVEPCPNMDRSNTSNIQNLVYWSIDKTLFRSHSGPLSYIQHYIKPLTPVTSTPSRDNSQTHI